MSELREYFSIDVSKYDLIIIDTTSECYFEYTKEYTYIVNSQDSLDYWLSNKTKGNSSGGADFTSVLIKAGNWQYVGETVALDILGTVSIDAEANTKLTCNSLRYNTLLYKDARHK